MLEHSDNKVVHSRKSYPGQWDSSSSSDSTLILIQMGAWLEGSYMGQIGWNSQTGGQVKSVD